MIGGEKRLKTYNFKDYKELADMITKCYSKYKNISEDFYSISVVAHYEVLIQVLNQFVKNTMFTLKNVHLENSDCSNYYDEWILTLNPNGEIWIQEAKYKTGYIFTEDDVVFVHNDVNSAFAVKNKDQNLVAFEVGDIQAENNSEICKDRQKSSVHYTTDDNGEMHGFTFGKYNGDNYTSYSLYTSNVLNDEFLQKMMKIFGI